MAEGRRSGGNNDVVVDAMRGDGSVEMSKEDENKRRKLANNSGLNK